MEQPPRHPLTRRCNFTRQGSRIPQIQLQIALHHQLGNHANGSRRRYALHQVVVHGADGQAALHLRALVDGRLYSAVPEIGNQFGQQIRGHNWNRVQVARNATNLEAPFEARAFSRRHL